MLIVCPNCATSYDIDVASLRPEGRKVRCVRCRTVWHAELPHADKLMAAAEALGPEPEAATVDAEAFEAAAPGPVDGLSEAAADSANDQPQDMPAFDAAVGNADFASAITPDTAAPDTVAPDPTPEMESPPIAPDDFEAVRSALDAAADQPAAVGVEPHEDIETVAARRAPPRSKRGAAAGWSFTPLQACILALIILDAIVIGWRVDIVRLMPQTASFYAWIGMPVNLRGLSFDGLATSTEQNENVPILVLEGQIINNAHKVAEIPHLRFAVRNAAHQEIYSWTAVPPRQMLPPGEAVAFRTRLASPPPDAHDVLVRFLNRYDIMTGAR